MTVALYALCALALYFAAMLAPLTDERAEMARAIAVVVDEDAPFYRGDEGKVRTLALHVAVAFREGGLQTSALGDGGRSFCAFQIHDSSGGTEALRTDPDACARKGHAMLRESVGIDRTDPVAFYARGGRYLQCRKRADDPPKVCAEARGISRDRVALADSLVRRLPR